MNLEEVVPLLELGNKQGITAAIDILQQYFDPQGDRVSVEFSECEELGGWARANARRIIVCAAAREEYFQYEQSIQVPDYAADYNVHHLTIVMLHEMGHVLDRRDKLPASVSAVSDDKEEVANAFVRHILSL